MANPTFYTPQISFPSSVKYSDCLPAVFTPDYNIARAYLVNNYTQRSTWKGFNKGITPPTFEISTYLNGDVMEYSIYLNNFSADICPETICDLLCTTADLTFTYGSNSSISSTYCINGQRPVYHFKIENISEGQREANPNLFSFSFIDANSNTITIDLESISYIKPAKPTLTYITNSSKVIYIGIKSATTSNYVISATKCIVESSYGSNFTNNKVLSTSSLSNSTFNVYTDYGFESEIMNYRVKFINDLGEESQWSDWSSIS